MGDKFEAAFHGGEYDHLVRQLAKSIERDKRRSRMRIAARNLLTTTIITVWFTVCLGFLSWWGYIPAILATAGYFTARDLM